MKAMKWLAGLALTGAMAGCASVDGAMSSISTVMDGTSDVLSGDFRMLADAKPATLGEIWADWKRNEVAAKKKWDAQAIIVPGVITRITKTDMVLIEDQFAIYFKDPKNSQCVGRALMRDALLVNQKKISGLQTGDRVNVTGVLATTASEWNSTNCVFNFNKAKIELATAKK